MAAQQIHGLLPCAGVDARSPLHQHSEQTLRAPAVSAFFLRKARAVGRIILEQHPDRIERGSDDMPARGAQRAVKARE